MNRKIYITLCLIIVFAKVNSAYAQSSQEATEYNKVSIASPTASSLSKFVDIPVSLHTGIPEINIPLYTLKDGAISLPISMSYHASGLKTLEPAGWVGAGWALNAGGVITRSVRGTPDEKGTVNNFQQTGFYSDYGYRTHLLSQSYGGRTDSSLIATYEQFNNGWKDSEPDLFFFNIGGYSGKFYFNDDRTPMLLPEQDIKIDVNYTYGSSESIQGFTLTTPDGTKYYFGATPSTNDTDPVEFTKVLTDQNGLGWDKVLSSWYLNKIVSADGYNTISLTYRPVVYSYYSISMAPTANQPPVGYKLIRNYIHGVELNNITSSNGQVNFLQAAQPRQDLSGSNTTGVEQVNGQYQGQNAAYPLGQIDILQKYGQSPIKSYKFDYSYFDDPNGPVATTLNVSATDKKRLKLLSIQEQSSGGTLSPPYKFDYFSEAVPRRLTFGQDHWGFINGVTTNGDQLVGTYFNTYNSSTPTTVAGADRDPHWPAMRGGTLQKITYPTGGYNLYDFEPNETYISTTTGPNGEMEFVDNVSAGYDGGQTTKTVSKYVSLGAYYYVFRVSNGNYGGMGHLNIYNSNNALIDHLNVSNNQVAEIQRNYAPGTYRFEVVKEMAYGGSGVSLSIYKQTSTVVNANAMVGGLRIKTITQNSGNGSPDMVTSYGYNDGSNNLSTGILFGKPTIAQVVRNDIFKNYFTVNPGTGTTGNTANGCPVTPDSGLPFLLSAASVRPMASSQGAHIGYRKVTTSQAGNGYTVSSFNVDGEDNIDHADIVNRSIITTAGNCTMNIPNYPAVPETNSFKRGQLEYKANFDNNGVLVSDVTYSDEYQESQTVAPAFVITANQGINNGNMIFSWYDQKTGRKTKETVTRKAYKPNGTAETKEESYYESPYHNQITRKVIVNSAGDILETRYKYVPDYTLSNVDGLDNGLFSYNAVLLNENNNFNALIAGCYGSVGCQRPAWLDYDIHLCHIRQNFINYRIANFTGPNNTYSNNLQQAFTMAGAELKPLIDLRKQNNFALIEAVNLKNNKITDATINTYNYYPESGNKVYLSKTSKVDFLLPESTFNYTATAPNNTDLNKDSRYVDKATFKYTFGNLLEVKPANNNEMSYLWGYNGQYPIAEAKNAKANEIYLANEEERTDFPDWGVFQDATRSHSGRSSGRVDNGNGGEFVVHSNTTLQINNSAPKSYHYSGWVYSNGPSIDIFLFMKRAGEGGYFSYVDAVSTGETGKWVYLSKDFLVPADVTQLNLRVDNNGSTNGQVQSIWFDDLRIRPSDAQMATYTYEPLVGMTSMTDSKGMVTTYGYDGFQRLLDIKDKDGNIVKRNGYHYQNQ